MKYLTHITVALLALSTACTVAAATAENAPAMVAADDPSWAAVLNVRAEAARRDRWPTSTADLDKLTVDELLDERWFEIEIVLFERLAVLEANTDENLVSYQPRAWPADLVSLRNPLRDRDLQNPGPMPDDWQSTFCLGYPELPVEDPIHPSRLPEGYTLDEDGIPSWGDEQYLEESADTLLEGSAEPVADPTDQAVEGETAENGEMAASELLEQTEATALLTPEPPPAPASELEMWLADVLEFEAQLYDSSYLPLPDLSLVNDVKALNRRRHLRPLIHQRWRQPVPDRDNPQPVLLHTENSQQLPGTRNGLAQIEGYIEVTVSRFLHVNTRLWYHADTLGLSPIGLPIQQLPPPPAGGFMELAERRRLRSEELHYLDHPKLGLLIRVTPIELPEQLISRQAQLAEAGE
ncbi:MAG: CsiV family protein [Pseudomonadota bacterium]